MNVSKEAADVSRAYDERAGKIRRWIMRNPNTMFWASFGSVVAAFWLGIKWAQFTAWLGRVF